MKILDRFNWPALTAKGRAYLTQAGMRGMRCARESRRRGAPLLRWLWVVVRPDRASFYSLVGVVLGYFVAVQADQHRANADAADELNHARHSVSLELRNDLQVLAIDIDLIDRDISAVADKKEIIVSELEIARIATQAAFLRGSFDSYSLDLSEKIGTLSNAIDLLNKRMEEREAYRLANGAMTNYLERLNIYDGNLKASFPRTAAEIHSVLDDLDKMPVR